MNMPSDIVLYWNMLSKIDQLENMRLKETFSSSNTVNKKYKASMVFSTFINQLKSFVMKGDSFDRIRAIVCGIYWYKDMLFVNSKNLMLIVSKCRSSINNSIVGLGYELVPSLESPFNIFLKIFPEFSLNYKGARQWTIRKLISPNSPIETKQVSVSNPINKIEDFNFFGMEEFENTFLFEDF